MLPDDLDVSCLDKLVIKRFREIRCAADLLRQWIKVLANDAVRFALGLGPSKPEDPEPEEVLSLPGHLGQDEQVITAEALR